MATPQSSHGERSLDAMGSCLVLESKGTKAQGPWLQNSSGTQVEAATKQQRYFLVLFSPVYFSLKQSSFSTKVCRELERAAVVPWGQDLAIKLFTKHCQAPGKQQQHRQYLHLFFKNNLHKSGACSGTSLHGWEENLEIKSMNCIGY